METQALGALVERIELENGLMLELYDASRPMAADRWLIYFLAAIEVDVREVGLSDDGTKGIALEELIAVLGEKVRFRHEKKSYFVDVRQKDTVFDKLRKDFLDTNLAYLSKPEFASSLIYRQYKVAKERRVTPIGIH